MFACDETRKIFEGTASRRFPADMQVNARRKLRLIHDAESMLELSEIPGNRFEKLKGSRDGQFSIRINSQWRICFGWRDNNAFDVEITDYH
jgi:toxin HigB-1